MTVLGLNFLRWRNSNQVRGDDLQRQHRRLRPCAWLLPRMGLLSGCDMDGMITLERMFFALHTVGATAFKVPCTIQHRFRKRLCGLHGRRRMVERSCAGHCLYCRCFLVVCRMLRRSVV